ncbi:hypothetical protein KY289_019507 [Solanum tuberosum]|nr:hypothetical protein KY289_019507 [Solanum tuberosum]
MEGYDPFIILEELRGSISCYEGKFACSCCSAVTYVFAENPSWTVLWREGREEEDGARGLISLAVRNSAR